MLKINFLNAIRKAEFDLVFKQLNLNTKDLSVLELGCGTGYQLTLLDKIFKKTIGIDIYNKDFEPIRSKQIILYDGISMPFDNNIFDVIFSSNTIEHISNIDSYDKEIKRVLTDNGYCIHILPSHHWRFWSIIGHYIILPVIIFKRFYKLSRKKHIVEINNPYKKSQSTNDKILREVANVIFPSRHGERGNRFSEYYLFKPKTWVTLFERYNYEIVCCFPVGLFYTAHAILGLKLSIKNRIKISKVIGSSCYCYLLKNKI
jgi:ubiquinone/menaquinone biosynthesis C-methylase UbiE